jgi:hypothetical protein
MDTFILFSMEMWRDRMFGLGFTLWDVFKFDVNPSTKACLPVEPNPNRKSFENLLFLARLMNQEKG